MSKRRKPPAGDGNTSSTSTGSGSSAGNGAHEKARAHPDYEVGYGRPPKASQFQKGMSGNPTGRKKGVLNSKTLLEKVLSLPVSVAFNGEQTKVTMIEGVLMRLGAEALKGNLKAAIYLADRHHEQFSGQDSTDETLSVEDDAVLARYAKRVRGDAQGGERHVHGHSTQGGSDTPREGVEDEDFDERGGDGHP